MPDIELVIIELLSEMLLEGNTLDDEWFNEFHTQKLQVTQTCHNVLTVWLLEFN